MQSRARRARRLDYRLLPGELRRTIVCGDEVMGYSVLNSICETHGTLFLLHGLASNGSRWEEFTEKTNLRLHWKIIRTDLRGHGGNESEIRATLEIFSRDCAQILDAEKSGPAVVIGHSLGAQVALKMAKEYRKKIDGIVLLDPLLSSALTPLFLKKKRLLPLARIIETVSRLLNALGIRRKLLAYNLRHEDEKAREMLQKGGEATQQFVKEFSSPINEIGHVHMATYMRDLLEVSRETPQAEDLDLPIFLIGSSAGIFTDPQKMKEWVRRCSDARIDILQCKHWPLTECPEEIRSLVENWINETFGQ